MHRKQTAIAKLSRPRLHDSVARERLFARLDDLLDVGAAWISGPPGSGKSTLVASYLASRSLTAYWYQADRDDADPATLFSYLVVLAKTFSRRGKALPYLTAEYENQIPAFARRFFRAMFARMPERSVLVFDNCHNAAHEDFHAVLESALTELPQSVSLAVISRERASGSLVRFVAGRSLGLLGGSDLEFTPDEARHVAVRAGLDPDRLTDAMLARTNGWAAGLILLIEQLRSGRLDREFERRGTNQPVFDYFASEIFDLLDEAARTVLMATALLPEVSPDAAVRLTGNSGAPGVLEDLYRRHYFTERRDEGPVVYRYHDLFRAFLVGRLEQSADSKTMKKLLQLGGSIVGDRDPEQAVHLYVRGEDWTHAEDRLLQIAPALIRAGRWRTLQDFVLMFPDALVKDSAWLLYWLGSAVLQTAPDQARVPLADAYERFRGDGNVAGQMICVATILQTYYYENEDFGQIDPWFYALRQLIEEHSVVLDSETELLVWGSALLGCLYRFPADPLFQRSLAWIGRRMDLEENPDLRLLAALHLLRGCLISWEHEHGRRATHVVEQTIDLVELPALLTCFGWQNIGYFHHQDASPAACEAALSHAENIASSHGLTQLGLLSLSFRVYHYTVSREFRAARQVLAEMPKWIRPGSSMDSSHYDLGQALYCGGTGDWAGAVAFAERNLISVAKIDSPSYMVMHACCCAAVLALAGCYDEAEARCAVADRHSEGSFLLRYRPTLLLIRSYVAMHRGQPETEARLLREAIDLGRRDDSQIWFRWTLRIMDVMFQRALDLSIETAHIRTLVRRFRVPAPDPMSDNWPWHVRIRTLGAFVIDVEAKPLVFGHKAPRKPLALLKALIAFGGQDIPQQKLIDALWGDESAASASESLRVTVHRLRRLLGSDDLISVADGRVSLDVGRCWVDVSVVTRLTAADLDAGTADRLLDLYRGPFLPGDDHFPWVLALRERLKVKILAYLSRAGWGREASGNWAGALDCWQLGRQIDDLAEEAYQGAMRCLAKLGRQAEAMAVYRALRQVLSVTLSIAPSAASESLFRSIAGSRGVDDDAPAG